MYCNPHIKLLNFTLSPILVFSTCITLKYIKEDTQAMYMYVCMYVYSGTLSFELNLFQKAVQVPILDESVPIRKSVN